MHEVIESERLRLRPLQQSDTADFARLADNPKICRMTGTFPTPFPAISVAGMVDIFLARAVTGKALHWAILKDGTFTGAIGLYRTDAGWEIGYWLGEPFWGQGLGSEALSAIVRHALACRPDARLSASVFTDNPASARVLEKAGFARADKTRPGYSLARRAAKDNWVFTLDGGGAAPKSAQAERQPVIEERGVGAFAP